MVEYGIKDIHESLLISVSESKFAQWRKFHNVNVVEYKGRSWEEMKKGYYQPIHLLARLDETEIGMPSFFCWGYRAALSEKDSEFANGAIIVHMLKDLSGFDLSKLSSNRRNHLRRCQKRAKIVEIINKDILCKFGYKVVCSALNRTKYSKPPSKKEYEKGLETYINDGVNNRLIIAGFIDGELGGYIESYAVEGVAYIGNVYISTEYLSSYIGTGLLYEFLQICRRSSTINQVVHGLHARENKSLDTFKEGIGFEVKKIPSKTYLNPFIGLFIKKKYPHKYYRLTGLS